MPYAQFTQLAFRNSPLGLFARKTGGESGHSGVSSGSDRGNPGPRRPLFRLRAVGHFRPERALPCSDGSHGGPPPTHGAGGPWRRRALGRAPSYRRPTGWPGWPTAPSSPRRRAPAYTQFEDAFPLADGFLALCLVAASYCLLTLRRAALFWLLAGGGAGHLPLRHGRALRPPARRVGQGRQRPDGVGHQPVTLGLSALRAALDLGAPRGCCSRREPVPLRPCDVRRS